MPTVQGWRPGSARPPISAQATPAISTAMTASDGLKTRRTKKAGRQWQHEARIDGGSLRATDDERQQYAAQHAGIDRAREWPRPAASRGRNRPVAMVKRPAIRNAPTAWFIV